MEEKRISFQVAVRLEARGLSREDLLEKTGIEKRKYYLCSTNRQKWRLDNLQSIAEYFGCKIEDLMQEIPSLYL